MADNPSNSGCKICAFSAIKKRNEVEPVIVLLLALDWNWEMKSDGGQEANWCFVELGYRAHNRVVWVSTWTIHFAPRALSIPAAHLAPLKWGDQSRLYNMVLLIRRHPSSGSRLIRQSISLAK